MKTHEIEFEQDGIIYHATVCIFSDKTYEVTECYRFDDELDSVDVDYRDFIGKIEEKIQDDIRDFERDYGGYSGDYYTAYIKSM